jgi:hypothetical protein
MEDQACSNTSSSSDNNDPYFLNSECKNQCRTSIILQHIEQYPESLARADEQGYLPLHRLLWKKSSSIHLALTIMEKYPAALQHQNNYGDLPLHVECGGRCRSAIIAKCMELYPEALSKADEYGCLPLHRHLRNGKSANDALMMINKYPAALQHESTDGQLPLILECRYHCRSIIISKCIELYPETLQIEDERGRMPLHIILRNKSSPIDCALMVIEKYPSAVQHQSYDDQLPIYIECAHQCRPSIISKCIESYPEGIDDDSVLPLILSKIDEDNFQYYSGLLSIIFTLRPMNLYHDEKDEQDIRDYCYYRRRILNLLPRAVFTPKHEADYRDLNWQPRIAMMMLLSHMKIQQQELSSESVRFLQYQR